MAIKIKTIQPYGLMKNRIKTSFDMYDDTDVVNDILIGFALYINSLYLYIINSTLISEIKSNRIFLAVRIRMSNIK